MAPYYLFIIIILNFIFTIFKKKDGIESPLSGPTITPPYKSYTIASHKSLIRIPEPIDQKS